MSRLQICSSSGNKAKCIGQAHVRDILKLNTCKIQTRTRNQTKFSWEEGENVEYILVLSETSKEFNTHKITFFIKESRNK